MENNFKRVTWIPDFVKHPGAFDVGKFHDQFCTGDLVLSEDRVGAPISVHRRAGGCDLYGIPTVSESLEAGGSGLREL